MNKPIILILMIAISIMAGLMTYKVIDCIMTSYLEPKEVTWTFIKEVDSVQAP